MIIIIIIILVIIIIIQIIITITIIIIIIILIIILRIMTNHIEMGSVIGPKFLPFFNLRAVASALQLLTTHSPLTHSPKQVARVPKLMHKSSFETEIVKTIVAPLRWQQRARREEGKGG